MRERGKLFVFVRNPSDMAPVLSSLKNYAGLSILSHDEHVSITVKVPIGQEVAYCKDLPKHIKGIRDDGRGVKLYYSRDYIDPEVTLNETPTEESLLD